MFPLLEVFCIPLCPQAGQQEQEDKAFLALASGFHFYCYSY
jgi:hypothetical protein